MSHANGQSACRIHAAVAGLIASYMFYGWRPEDGQRCEVDEEGK